MHLSCSRGCDSKNYILLWCASKKALSDSRVIYGAALGSWVPIACVFLKTSTIVWEPISENTVEFYVHGSCMYVAKYVLFSLALTACVVLRLRSRRWWMAHTLNFTDWGEHWSNGERTEKYNQFIHLDANFVTLIAWLALFIAFGQFQPFTRENCGDSVYEQGAFFRCC